MTHEEKIKSIRESIGKGRKHLVNGQHRPDALEALLSLGDHPGEHT
jgi:hypothetical protein